METKSKKPTVNFNDFWPDLKAYAARLGLNKGEWLKRSGIAYQRFSEFDASEGADNKRDVSAFYFIRLTGGLNLDPGTIERKLNRKFSPEQVRKLQFHAQVDANADWLEDLLADPETIKICKSIVAAKKG